MKSYLSSLLLLVLILLNVQNSFAQTVVMGKVVYSSSKSPVNGAAVVVDKDTVFTDSLGSFTIINQKNTKKLWVITDDFLPQSVSLSDSNEYALTIELQEVVNTFVSDKKLKGKDINHVSKLGDSVLNDTSRFTGVQGKFVGIIRAKQSDELLEYTSVYMKEMVDGTLSDSLGQFEILFDGDSQNVTIDALGYEVLDTLVRNLGEAAPVTIYLTPRADMLEGVTVYARKKRYRNKNNHAVALMRLVIDRKSRNKMLGNESARFREYDKMVIHVSNMPKFIATIPIFKPIRVIFRNEDTSLLPPRRLMPLFVSETIADHYFDAQNKKNARVQTAEKRVRFDAKLIESNNISSFLNRLYDQVDIYDDQIRVLNNFFLSPIAPLAPNLYKFFIVDTTFDQGRPIVQLRFEPRNTNDFLFEGRVFVTLAPEYAVTKIEMRVPKGTPLNWTNGLNIDLGFEKQANGKYWQTRSRYQVNFGLFNSKRGVVGIRYSEKSNFEANPIIPDTVFGPPPIVLETQKDTMYQRSKMFWQGERALPLTSFEQRAYDNLDSLRGTAQYKRLIKTMYVLGMGHYPTKYLEFGSIYDAITYNPIEGLKLRAGVKTNIKEWQKLLLEGYLAYGTKDQRFKYYLGGTFSLNNKFVFGYPMHNIKLSYQYDVRAPGQAMGFASQEKTYEVVRRGDGNRYLYNGIFSALWTKEYGNRMTTSVGYDRWTQEAAGSLYFEKANGQNDTINLLKTNEFTFNWRFSPGEYFYQNKRYRSYAENKAWIFNVKGTFGFNQGYSDQTINYQKFEAKIEKRFFFAPLGYAYMEVDAGYLLGAVPYPYLFVPRANQSYVYKIRAYNLMNFMEFASDKYVSLKIDYHMKGFLLNRIPLVKKMYLREVFGFKAIYGSIRDENLPSNNSSLLKFPVDNNGKSIVNSFENKPYIEASVGVENVIKMIRLDFVKRFTHLHHPLVAEYAFRFSFGLDF